MRRRMCSGIWIHCGPDLDPRFEEFPTNGLLGRPNRLGFSQFSGSSGGNRQRSEVAAHTSLAYRFIGSGFQRHRLSSSRSLFQVSTAKRPPMIFRRASVSTQSWKKKSSYCELPSEAVTANMAAHMSKFADKSASVVFDSVKWDLSRPRTLGRGP